MGKVQIEIEVCLLYLLPNSSLLMKLIFLQDNVALFYLHSRRILTYHSGIFTSAKSFQFGGSQSHV